MEIDQIVPPAVQKNSVFKKKPRNKQYYRDLKKNLRRMIKCGVMPDVSKIDDEIAKIDAMMK